MTGVIACQANVKENILRLIRPKYFLANVIPGQEDDGLQFTDEHLQKSWVAAVKQFHAGDGLEVDVERHVRHHLAGKIAQNFSFVETFLGVPGELAPSLHSLHGLGRNLNIIQITLYFNSN